MFAFEVEALDHAETLKETPARCEHYADLYGRCVDCGMTWKQRRAHPAVQDQTDGGQR